MKSSAETRLVLTVLRPVLRAAVTASVASRRIATRYTVHGVREWITEGHGRIKRTYDEESALYEKALNSAAGELHTALAAANAAPPGSAGAPATVMVESATVRLGNITVARRT